MLTSQRTAQSFSFNTPKLTNSKKCVVETLTDTKQVCDKPCILLAIGATFVSDFQDGSPNTVDDIDNVWDGEDNSIDGDTGTLAECTVPQDTFTGYLVFDLGDPYYVTHYYFAVTIVGTGIQKMQVDYWNGTEWINSYFALFTASSGIKYKPITPVVMQWIRIRFTRSLPGDKIFRVREFGVTASGMFDIRLHDGFGSDYDRKHRIILSHTGSYFVSFSKPVYYDKGLYLDNVDEPGNVCLHYLVLKDRAWFTPPTLQPQKQSIPELSLFARLFRLLRGWFIK